jgi:hypothetical protein
MTSHRIRLLERHSILHLPVCILHYRLMKSRAPVFVFRESCFKMVRTSWNIVEPLLASFSFHYVVFYELRIQDSELDSSAA